ncbi:MAG TPA: helix-turn-helix domain-containing protein [Synechococcales cyanobacterium M55_K2018_004]|nr:helix-turn-helix domain-containing protein [Synechococcales cyanobacterium M55_K2018_004]
MVGVYKLEIAESVDELKQLMKGQKTASAKERIQLLYLLKTRQAQTVKQAATLLGRHRATLQEWLREYRQGGLDQLLAHKVRSGRPRAIPAWAETALEKRLQEPQGFASYQDICDWLANQLGIQANYKTVHKLVHYRLQASPKVSRPMSVEQSSEQGVVDKQPSSQPNTT